MVIKSLSDLPKKGIVEKRLNDFGLSKSHQDGLAIFYTSESKNEAYVLATEKYYSGALFFQLKKELRRKKIKVSTYRIEEKLIDALYEKHEEDRTGESDDQRSEYQKFFYEMIGDAVAETVSDVHIERRKDQAIIRMRKHGELSDYAEISASYAMGLASVIYTVIASEKDITFDPDGYQSAAVNLWARDIEVKLRYQSVPVYPNGFDVIMRVLPLGKGDEDESVVPLQELGYSSQQVKMLLSVTSRPVGALVIAGTTGSGKSTTLKNLLMILNPARGYKHKIYTVEDPPEYKIPKVSQIPVVRLKSEDYTKKSPFEDPLTAAMRADPDLLVIGEVRDKFTADGLKKATQSGHQVMTTIHTPSALGIVERLADYQISYNVLGAPEFLMGLCYQKLVLELCPHCCLDFTEKLNSSLSSDLDLELAQRIDRVLATNGKTLTHYPIKIKNEEGCEKCEGLGVKGRTVCAEIITPTFEMLECFKNQDNLGAYKVWRSLSDNDFESEDMEGKTVLEHAIHKMINGTVSPYALEDAFGPIDTVITAHRSKKDVDEDVNDLDDDWEDFEV